MSYKIKVTPPNPSILIEGRRRRAAACLRTLEEDYSAVMKKVETSEKDRTALQEEIAALEKQVLEMETTLQSLRMEEVQLKKLVGLQEPVRFMSENLFD